jgi:hypothetical protein
MQMPGHYLEEATTVSFQILSISSFTNHQTLCHFRFVQVRDYSECANAATGFIKDGELIYCLGRQLTCCNVYQKDGEVRLSGHHSCFLWELWKVPDLNLSP